MGSPGSVAWPLPAAPTLLKPLHLGSQHFLPSTALWQCSTNFGHHCASNLLCRTNGHSMPHSSILVIVQRPSQAFSYSPTPQSSILVIVQRPSQAYRLASLHLIRRFGDHPSLWHARNLPTHSVQCLHVCARTRAHECDHAELPKVQLWLPQS